MRSPFSGLYDNHSVVSIGGCVQASSSRAPSMTGGCATRNACSSGRSRGDVAADEFCAVDGAANTRLTTATSSVRNRRAFTSGLDDRRRASVRPSRSMIDHIAQPSLLDGMLQAHRRPKDQGILLSKKTPDLLISCSNSVVS